MAEIQTGDGIAVNNFLKTTFGVADDTLRQAFTEVAMFLADTAKVRKHLEVVSAKLRTRYHEIADGDQRSNVLTRAILSLAPNGFAVQQNVVFAGYISPTDITKDYIAKKVLWKDGVGSQHGEFSHSLQWLAIADAGILVDVADTYSKTTDYKANKTFQRPNDGKMTPYVWDFLVDCFSHGSNAPDWKTHIITKTPRSPSHLNHLLFTDWNHLWISTLLRDRYQRKGLAMPVGNDSGEDLKQLTVGAHDNKTGYAKKASAGGAIYTRDVAASTKRRQDSRGLPRLQGKVDSQEIVPVNMKVPKVIKVGEKMYTVPKADRPGYAQSENWAGAKVEFELLGNPAQIPSAIKRL